MPLDLAPELQGLKDADLHRVLRVMTSAPGARVELEGAAVINFASNNYLDLAGDLRLKRAAQEAVERWGAGATASRLLGGTLDLHERLERALAEFKGAEAAAVFPSGYHVNMGLIPSLVGPEDVVFLDRLCHASLVDGARLSRARLKVFRHNDPEDLEKALRRSAGSGKRWVITETLFSMDGDVAPLAEIAAVAERFGAHTYVDEAHATGVLGPEGRGVVAALGLEKKIDACMGTLSKALGGQGGFVCGRRELIEWVHNKCRSFIYSTALAPASLASALAALEICRTEPERRTRLAALAGRLRKILLPPSPPPSPLQGEGANLGPIVPRMVGTEKDALRLSRRLWDEGFFVPAIRPPTVPKGTCRLRFSVTAAHTEADIERAAEVLLS